MKHLGLSAADTRAYMAQLVGNCERRTRVEVISRDHEPIAEARFVDGQVEIDITAEVTRTASVTLLDPDSSLGLDPDEPTDGQVHLARMLRVTVEVFVESLDEWVGCPVITGPIREVQRDGSTITCSVQGKESIALYPSLDTRQIARGTRKVSAIRALLWFLTGESQFFFPDWDSKLVDPIDITSRWVAWPHAQKLAATMGAYLFYDGAGVCRLRKAPVRTAFTFTPSMIQGTPKISHGSSEFTNTVHVLGAEAQKGKKRPDVTAWLHGSHPLSPHALRRTGVDGPRGEHHIEQIQDENIKSQKSAEEIARRRVRELEIVEAEVTFDCLPIWPLEERDLLRLVQPSYAVGIRFQKATLPLGEGLMTVGAVKKVRPARPRRPSRRRR